MLLGNRLNECKEREIAIVDKHIKILQKAFQDTYCNTKQGMLFKMKNYNYTNSRQYCSLYHLNKPNF